MHRVLVWDLPVRLFHWLLAVGVCAAFAIAETADDNGVLFVWHMIIGLLLALVTVLRLVWGAVGARYARFREFSFQPRALFEYFKGLLAPTSRRHHVGHNPATSYAAIAIFLAVLGLSGSGLLMASGNGGELEEVHEILAFGLVALAGLHVVGVALHSIRHRDKIAWSMIDGKKLAAPESGIPSSHVGAALGGLLCVVAATAWLLAGYDGRMGRVVLPGTEITVGAESDKKGGRQKQLGERSFEHHGNEDREHDSDD